MYITRSITIPFAIAECITREIALRDCKGDKITFNRVIVEALISRFSLNPKDFPARRRRRALETTQDGRFHKAMAKRFVDQMELFEYNESYAKKDDTPDKINNSTEGTNNGQNTDS